MTMRVTVQEYSTRNKIHPHKFALWAGCASLMMMFAALTSAYMVRMAAGNWLEFELPAVFRISTAIMVASSLTVHGAYIAYKKGLEKPYKLMLAATFLLGAAFFVSQYLGWQTLQQIGVPFTLNPSGDFVYVISWLHAAHVAGGIAVLAVALIHAFGLPFRVTPRRTLRLELSVTYWHFVDVLWLYLFIFLSTYR
ncbi:MAG: hypothetical protein RLY31_399 [Bacteroidota bacterium]